MATLPLADGCSNADLLDRRRSLQPCDSTSRVGCAIPVRRRRSELRTHARKARRCSTLWLPQLRRMRGWIGSRPVSPLPWNVFVSGRQRRSRRGMFAAATPVLSALEQYHSYRGKYPDSLRLLVPSYLDSARLPHNQYGFMYRADSGQYQLGFHYNGPGMNTCTLRSREKRWSCYGLF